MLAIIGGTGLSRMEGFEAVGTEVLDTPFGEPAVELQLFRHGDTRLAFLPRHGSGHIIPPHKINYRANIWALNELGVNRVVAVNAVGGIHKELPPGAFAVPDQIIDYTVGRASTFFEDDLEFVTHIDFTYPFDQKLREALLASIERANATAAEKRPLMAAGVYGCTQGPRLETAAEVRRLQRDGCDLVGMTGMPEAALARELEVAYAMLAFSVNWAAGLTEGEITMEQIQATVDDSMGFVKTVLQELVDGE